MERSTHRRKRIHVWVHQKTWRVIKGVRTSSLPVQGPSPTRETHGYPGVSSSRYLRVFGNTSLYTLFPFVCLRSVVLVLVLLSRRDSMFLYEDVSYFIRSCIVDPIRVVLDQRIGTGLVKGKNRNQRSRYFTPPYLNPMIKRFVIRDPEGGKSP